MLKMHKEKKTTTKEVMNKLLNKKIKRLEII